jgi:hypothetical protein
MARLPLPGGDNGNWGNILNDYLSQVHKADGTLKDGSVTNTTIAADAVNATSIADGSITNGLIADGTIAEAKLANAVQTKLNATGDWNTLSNKPAVIAAGADAAAARTAISAAPSQGSSYYRRARYVPATNGTDDLAAIQAVLDEGPGIIVFPKGGTWTVTPPVGGIMLQPQSNTRIIVEEGATVQVKANSLDLYYLFHINAKQNVTIEGGGTLLGDALTHTESLNAQYGHLINITNGSSDIRIIGPLLIKQAMADGIYIGGGLAAVNTDILIDGVRIEDCRREGIAPFWVDGCIIRNCRITDIALTSQHSPGTGIDVEPNDGQWVNNLLIENNYIENCPGNGMYISTLPAGGTPPFTTNLIVRGNRIVGCGYAPFVAGHSNGIYIRDIDDPILIDNIVKDSGFVGDSSGLSAGIKLNLCDRPIIKGGRISGSTGSGILISSGTKPEVSGVTVYDNDFRGMNTGTSSAIIRGNHIFDNVQAGGSSEHHLSLSGDGNVVTGNVFRGSNGNSWVRISSGNDNLVANNVGLSTAPTNKTSDAGTNTIMSGNIRKDTGVYEAWTTSNRLVTGTIDVGDPADTTISRVSAGRIAVEGVNVPTISSTDTLTNKTIDFTSNTVTMTKAQLNTAVLDADVATLTGTETLTNKTLTAPVLDGVSTIPQNATIATYNTVDQTTNYERARQYWSGNIYTIQTEAGGTGTVQTILISAGASNSIAAFPTAQTSAVGTTRLRASSSTANATIAGVNGTQSSSSGLQYGLAVSPTYTQTSTAGYTALLVNPTETSVGSGVKKLIDAQVGSSSKFAVDNTGKITVSGTSATISAGTGTPEGVLTATVGSMFMRTDGGAGTSFYIKESGAGNTGWVAK